MDDVVSLDILYADEYIPEELYQLVQDDLYSQLDTRLDELSNSAEYLTALRWHDQQQLTLLMVAALNGSDEIVRILFKHCQSKCQIELKGQVKLYNTMLVKDVTALYCACYRGHFTVAKTLIEIGQANVKHGTHDYPNQPLLIDAIRRNREDIIHFLLENKYADVNETILDDYDPPSALIWAVYEGSISIVKYLIENGADVNYSTERNLRKSSAVMCATFWGRLDILRLLVNAGANINIKCRTGDTLLIIAAEHKHHTIVRFLLEQSINHSVDDLELAACSLCNISSSTEQVDVVFDLLKLALEQRQSLQMSKICIEPMYIYDYQQECQTIDELNRIKTDRDRIFIETLLIRERMYSSKKDISIIEPLANYADRFEQKNQFDKCFHICIRIFDLNQQIESKYTNLARFVWLFCKMMTKNQLIPIQHFLQASYLTFQLTKISSMDVTLFNALFLVIIADKILQEKTITKEEKILIYTWIRDLCRHQLTTPCGKTLLHLCVDENTNFNLNFRRTDTIIHLKFPNQSGLSLLLFCGIRWLDVNTRESVYGNTPLHLICKKSPDENIIKLLLNCGSHIDCINKDGKIPFDYLNDKRIKSLFETKRTPHRLKCLCARMIVQKHFNTTLSTTFTSTLNKFIFLHGNLSTLIHS